MRDLLIALSFLTVLPLPLHHHPQAGRSFGWFPLVGLIIGTGLIAVQAAAPAPLAPLLVLAAWVVLTGGLHLDGFADACDGLFAATSPDRRLEIMKDPRTGTWAVVGVALLLLVKFTLVGQVEPIWLLLSPMAGRWAIVIAAVVFPYVGGTGLGAYFRQGLTRWQLVHASVFSAAVTVIALSAGQHSAFLMLAVPLAALGVGRWAAERLGGGLTGDIYGAVCELIETLFLLGVVWTAA
jgi:adenosylcobinamide-GDP ribazoletransferase